MRKIVTLILLVVLLIFCYSNLTSCSLLFDKSLHLKKEQIQENSLRLDGYYYSDYNVDATVVIDRYGNNRTEKQTYRGIYFLYKNGVIINAQNRELNDTNNYEDWFRDKRYNEMLKKGKYNWGICNITNETIRIELWYCAEVCITAVDEGKILNDTTFVITESYQLRKNGTKKKFRKKEETYHFKQFGPKPDSTNSFIK